MQNPMKARGQHSRSPPHPRRPPAHKSVSLVHGQAPGSRSSARRQTTTQSGGTNTDSASNQANPSRNVASKPTIKYKQSSGQSSNAEGWFERTNNNPDQSNTLYTNNEPPFFLRNSSSSETPPDVVEGRMTHLHPSSSTSPYRPGLMRGDTHGSSSEDFRSVIDDLTVENKNLKRRLKKYEQLHDAHLQSEKLFEVKVHGLAPEKKKELEDLLRKFASNTAVTSDTRTTPSSGNQFSAQETERFPPSFIPNHTTSSLSSLRVADSGYASNSFSASGQTSVAPSGQDGHNQRKLSKSAKARQQQNVQSYLRDIPVGLLPTQHAVVMSEKSKKKMVVRRLEQIFAGKGAGIGSHPQPLQQQEVAQSAANADRKAIEASGLHARKEGIREARIMPETENSKQNDPLPPTGTANLQRLDPSAKVSELDFAGEQSPDQRPTRPLDLDPHRAQVAEENIEYIRHLGFSPPDPDSNEAQPDGHGWIYLNLLANMAQLHTINVTPEFVRKAVQEYSKKLELCPHGHKVRWKGGRDVTRTSSDNSPEYPSKSKDKLQPRKRDGKRRVKLGHGNSEHSSIEPSKASAPPRKKGELAYTPLFFHDHYSDEEGNNSDVNMSIWSSNPLATSTSPGFTGSGFKSSTPRMKRKHGHDGPIIFYHGNFCTDLSRKEDTHAVDNKLNYIALSTHPVGYDTRNPLTVNYGAEVFECKGALAQAHFDDRMDVEDCDSSTDNDLKMSVNPSPRPYTDCSAESIDFEASGLGGVEPKDNFSIEVRRQKRRDREPAPIASHCYRSRHYSSKIQDILVESGANRNRVNPSLEAQKTPVVSEQVIAMRRKDLPASSVPEPTYMHYESSESSDDDSDSESVSDTPFLDHLHPTPAPQMRTMSSPSPDVYSSDEEDDDVSSDGASDGSLDLLATAREIDPHSVIKKEREYDAEVAERLAEEIPAGSSAATAGGGSGFNSPDIAGMNNVRPSNGNKVVKGNGGGSASSMLGKGSATAGAAMVAPSLKRARTSDSQVLPEKVPRKAS